MPYGPPLSGIFWGHSYCKYVGWGWSEFFSTLGNCCEGWERGGRIVMPHDGLLLVTAGEGTTDQASCTASSTSSMPMGHHSNVRTQR